MKFLLFCFLLLNLSFVIRRDPQILVDLENVVIPSSKKTNEPLLEF